MARRLNKIDVWYIYTRTNIVQTFKRGSTFNFARVLVVLELLPLQLVSCFISLRFEGSCFLVWNLVLITGELCCYAVVWSLKFEVWGSWYVFFLVWICLSSGSELKLVTFLASLPRRPFTATQTNDLSPKVHQAIKSFCRYNTPVHPPHPPRSVACLTLIQPKST